MDVQQMKRRKIPRGRILIVVVVLILVISGSILWVIENQGPWLNILPVLIFTVLGVILALFQWLFPLPSGDAEPPTRHIVHHEPAHAPVQVPPIVVQVPPHSVSAPLQQLSEPSEPSYYSIEGVPPPTDPRTIQQREMAVKEVYVKLTRPDITAIVLTGIGGVGKSTLAALIYRYAEEQRLAGKGPFTAEGLWLKIDSAAVTMNDLIGTIFHALGKPLPNVSKLAPHNQAATLFNALNTADDARLVVLDQFENLLDGQTGHTLVDGPGIAEWLDAINGQPCKCRVLLTSRPWPLGTRMYPPTYMQEYRVRGLSDAEGIELLRTLLQLPQNAANKNVGTDEAGGSVDAASRLVATENELRQAVDYCAGHAYALTLLAALLRNRHLSLSTFFKDTTYGQLWTGNVARNLLDRIYMQQLDDVQRQLLLAFSLYREPVSLDAALAIADPDQRIPRAQLYHLLDGLLTQHLLQSTGEGLYQLHAIVVSYAHDHFDTTSEQANAQALKAGRVKAAQYYQHYALQHCPARSQRRERSDVQPLEEAVWQLCLAEQWPDAYALIVREHLYHDLLRWGYAVVIRELYEFLLPLTKWATRPKQEARVYDELGEVYRQLGQMLLAQNCFEQALSLARETGDSREEGWALNSIGRVYADLGKKQEALHYYEDALKLLKQARSRSGESNVLENIGWAYYDVGQMELAREKYEEALRLRRELRSRRGEAHVLNSLGRIYENLGQFAEARAILEEAQTICREIADRVGEAWTLNNLGRIYSRLQQREQSQTYFEQSLRIRHEIGDRRGESATLNNLGFLYSMVGERERARECYTTALLIRREVGDLSGEGKTLNNLGLLYAAWGRHEQAISYFKDALRIRQEIGHIKRQGKTLNNLGLSYAALQTYDIALACHLLAQECFTQLLTEGSGVQLRENPTQEYIDQLRTTLGDSAFDTLLASVQTQAQHIVKEALRK